MTSSYSTNNELSCCWGPFQKQSAYALPWLLGALWKQNADTLQLILTAVLTAEYLHITVAVRDPFKSRVLTRCRCCWGSFWKKSTCTLQLLLGPLWKQTTYLWSASEYIMWVDNTFFTKSEKMCTRNTSRRPWKRGARSKRLARLTVNTTLDVVERRHNALAWDFSRFDNVR